MPKRATYPSNIPQRDGRPAPAYQVYASDEMADLRYKEMTLAERGLYCTLRDQLWCSGRLPANPAKIAKVIGEQESVVTPLLPAVMKMFEVDGDQFFSPELERQRRRKAIELQGKSEGGKKGAATTNSVHKNSGASKKPPVNSPAPTPANDAEYPDVYPGGYAATKPRNDPATISASKTRLPKGEDRRGPERSGGELNRGYSQAGEDIFEDVDYERDPNSAESYLKASNGE